MRKIRAFHYCKGPGKITEEQLKKFVSYLRKDDIISNTIGDRFLVLDFNRKDLSIEVKDLVGVESFWMRKEELLKTIKPQNKLRIVTKKKEVQ